MALRCRDRRPFLAFVFAAVFTVVALVPAVEAQPPSGSAGQRDAAPSSRFRQRWFEQRPWYEPLVADPDGGQVTVLGLALSSASPFSLTTGSRLVWDVTVGKELPITLWEKVPTGDAELPAGVWGFGFWFPIGFHVVEDLREPETPIVNTDYRFGAAFKAVRGLNGPSGNSVGLRVQFGHQSSHLGDEFLLNAQREFGSAFDRVDVTYQYIDAGLSYDRIVGVDASGRVTLRVNGMHTFYSHGKHGFYVPVTYTGRALTASARNFEPGLGIEYTPVGMEGLRPFLSLDVRGRTVFDYDRPPGTTERRGWSYSLAIGLRPLAHDRRGTPEPVFRMYYGVNPNGQLRTQRRYWLIGAGVHVRV
jgi:hypothetical protein